MSRPAQGPVPKETLRTLKRWLRQRQMTHLQFGAHVGCTKSFVSMILSGSRPGGEMQGRIEMLTGIPRAAWYATTRPSPTSPRAARPRRSAPRTTSGAGATPRKAASAR